MGFFKSVKHVSQARQESSAKLQSYAACPFDELYSNFSTTESGLSADAAAGQLEEFGPNVIQSGQSNTLLHRLISSVVNPFNIVLFIIGIITWFTDVFLSAEPDYLTVIIIFVLIFVSGLIAFIQGEQSNSAAQKLSDMIQNKADVFRDGTIIEIPIDEIVPGDILKLSAGDMIPADVRFISAKDAFIAQAALTGESDPVEKFATADDDELEALTDLKNIGFMGSNMVSGSALVIVLLTGNDTYFGSMAKTLSGDRAKNSFEKGVDSVSQLLIRLMLIMVPVIFLINGITKGDWLSSLLFAVSIAVGLTPEMLPVIMTTTLARGAVAMSKHKVIIKTLGAIQTFGEMDVLCTDKTGTLTEDKIILEKYMNAGGTEDLRILRHACLNSYFQTGLKNLIDLAIINRTEKENLSGILQNYHRVDEIPFDFTRRRMSVVLQDQAGKRQLITKGAAEEIIAICTYIEINGQIRPLTAELKQHAYDLYQTNSAEGLRMLAIAQKNEIPDVNVFSISDESNMVLIGFVGFLDPPKESAKSAIAALADHGIKTVVLTGDSEGVALKVCAKVGVDANQCISGREVEAMTDNELLEAVDYCSIFAKLSPTQKERLVHTFQKKGHTVGYMGDGINDALPMHQADVGISVDSAVDIAKETADIILMEKDLMVLEQGVIAGRKTFGNIVKYIKMAASGNFGNMISVMIASIFLPFMPMLPVQILAQNLLCDFSQMGIPFDQVDPEYIKHPRRWNPKSISRFMTVMGPLSSLFDILCYAVMWWIIGANTPESSRLFQCGWFVFGTVSQILVVYMIRTAKVPFLQSRPALPLLVSGLTVAALTIVVGFTRLSKTLDMAALGLNFVPWLILLLVGYCLATQVMKKLYIRKFNEWL